MEDVPLAPDPALAATARAALGRLGERAAGAEDELLATLLVTGDPRAQRVVDDWVDQVADTLRALVDRAEELDAELARYAGPPSATAAHADGRVVARPVPGPATPGRR